MKLSGVVMGLLLTIISARILTQASDRQRLVGTWRVIAFTTDGRADAIVGERPRGFIFYDDQGNMAAQIMPDRPRPSWTQARPPTPEQAAQAIIGFTAYFGTYSIDEAAHVITHHREGGLNANTGELKRAYRFASDDTLTLTALDNPATMVVLKKAN